MPTRNDFEDAATRMRRITAALDEFASPLENQMGADVLEGGDLTDSVYEAIKATRVTALSLSTMIEEYALEADRRAEEAAAAAKAASDYEEDLERYEFEMRVRDNYEDASFTQRQRQKINARRAGVSVEGAPPTKPTPPPPPADYIDL